MFANKKSLPYILGITLLAAIAGFSAFSENATSGTKKTSKINGLNFVAPPNPISKEQMSSIQLSNGNWVGIVPYGYSRGNSPNVWYDTPRQWWGERSEGTIKTIAYAKSMGLKIMLKPHVWVLGQGWAGDYQLATDEEWQQWEKDYEKYILAFAHIADSMDVEMFCIGTEYRKAVVARPDFWRQLIKKTRDVYDGKVTYAANWDNYQNVQFWDLLDYIGIDAYFPLSDTKTPNVATLAQGWNKDFQDIDTFRQQWQKPVIFTEYGYQSIDYNTEGHWKLSQDTLSVNLEAQANAYEALYRTFWPQSWFHGGFLWKWHANHSHYGGPSCKRFTPQNKPALDVVKKWYADESIFIHH
ncbi:MAG: hypothetical protein AAFX87_14400 [Bacteroidota bacterium]